MVQYMTDEGGKRTAVVVPVEDYEQMLDALEELEDIREFDKLQGNEEFIPWEEAKKELGLQD
jgi:PHD/YefM family antitoxin component YafN of YafNO toxin-antitoxin module